MAFLAVLAVLGLGPFLGPFAGPARAGGSSFLDAASPLAPGSLIESRGGVGVSTGGETEEERRRLAARPGGSLSGVAAPLPRNGSLPATRTVSRATDFTAPPALVTAVRNELSALGLR